MDGERPDGFFLLYSFFGHFASQDFLSHSCATIIIISNLVPRFNKISLLCKPHSKRGIGGKGGQRQDDFRENSFISSELSLFLLAHTLQSILNLVRKFLDLGRRYYQWTVWEFSGLNFCGLICENVLSGFGTVWSAGNVNF